MGRADLSSKDGRHGPRSTSGASRARPSRYKSCRRCRRRRGAATADVADPPARDRARVPARHHGFLVPLPAQLPLGSRPYARRRGPDVVVRPPPHLICQTPHPPPPRAAASASQMLDGQRPAAAAVVAATSPPTADVAVATARHCRQAAAFSDGARCRVTPRGAVCCRPRPRARARPKFGLIRGGHDHPAPRRLMVPRRPRASPSPRPSPKRAPQRSAQAPSVPSFPPSRLCFRPPTRP